MKNTRIILTLLMVALLLPSFAGCVNNQGNENGSSSSVAESVQEENEAHPSIAKKDYASDFYFTIMSHVNQPDYYWVEESLNNNLSDAIYNRQLYVQEYLGVEVFGKTQKDPNLYVSDFQTAVKNRDDSVHMLLSHCSTAIDGFITGNYFMDYNDMTSIDLSADYWNYDFMDELSINGHLYLGYSDFNIIRTNVVAFNKEMLSKYGDSIGEPLYDIVEDYRWTLDKMISVSDLVYIDTTSDGKTIDDTFGLSSDYEVPYASLLQACNINIVEPDEKGAYKIAVYNEANKTRTATLVDKLYNLVRDDSAYFDADPSFGPPASVFVNGRALMYLARTTTLQGFLDDNIDFGVLPYPMYDEAQKSVGYRSLQWGGYICVPSYLKNPNMVFDTLEIISFASKPVNIAYYEKLLGKQIADAPDDRKMLDIVWESACSDFGLTYGSATEKSFCWILSAVTKMGTSQSLSSYIAANEGTANRNLKKFIAQVK